MHKVLIIITILGTTLGIYFFYPWQDINGSWLSFKNSSFQQRIEMMGGITKEPLESDISGNQEAIYPQNIEDVGNYVAQEVLGEKQITSITPEVTDNPTDIGTFPTAIISPTVGSAVHMDTISPSQITAIPTPTPTISTSVISGFSDYINVIRQENKVSTLTETELACTIANQRIVDVQNNYSHDGIAGYSSQYQVEIGENLARNYSTYQQAVTSWMSSEYHRSNLLDPTWTALCTRISGIYYLAIFIK